MTDPRAVPRQSVFIDTDEGLTLVAEEGAHIRGATPLEIRLRQELEERDEAVWETGHKAGRAFEKAHAVDLRELVKRATPFVNAVAAMADDRAPALAWLADASLALDEEVDSAAS